MSEDAIQKIWDQGKGRGEKTREEIEACLRPKYRRSALSLRIFVYLYLGVLAATLVLEMLNIHGYRSNPTMLAVQVGVTLITLVFIAYAIHLLLCFSGLDRADESLLCGLERRKHFYRTRYEIWIWMMAGTSLLLIFAVNTMMDNQNGLYPINSPVYFGTVHVVVFLAMYVFLKLSHYPFVRHWKAILRDLESQVTDHTEHIERLQRTWWLYGSIVMAIVLIILFLWSLL